MERFIEFNHQVIPVVEEKEEQYWFVGNVIAEALGYKNPRQALNKVLTRNPQDFEGFILSTQIDYEGQMREVTLLNEEGIYTFCMLAKTDLAVRFRRVVAEKIREWRVKETLPAIQTNGLAVVEQQLQLFNAIVDQMKQQETAIQEVKNEVNDLKRGLIDINQPLREQFVAINRQTAGLANMHYQDVFNYVYRLIREQKHKDIKLRAKNATAKRGKVVKPIDILEEEGMLGYAVQLAKACQEDLNPNSPKWRQEVNATAPVANN